MNILTQLFLMADKNDIGKIVKVNIENSNQNTLFGKIIIK